MNKVERKREQTLLGDPDGDRVPTKFGNEKEITTWVRCFLLVVRKFEINIETEKEKTTWGVAGLARMPQEGGGPPPKKEEVLLPRRRR